MIGLLTPSTIWKNALLTEFLLNDGIASDRYALPVYLGKASFVDQFTN
ncbi:hypothetical protein ALC60_13304 [Trachymyrmex zeteki]|uniref:Uncharacterized protein n=1 Tax=Mycetomoellerius zeteki TaxID=64791 RepID=A0A151WI59_9HYME|nr:hypothetical protein ALC60_13304 [Trachymyrmex zeteki]